MHEVQERPVGMRPPVDDAWLAAALAAKKTTPAWTPLTSFALPPASRLPNIYASPVLAVTLPPEMKAFLADLDAQRKRAYDDINACYARETRDARSQTVRAAWDRRAAAHARVEERYAFDVEALGNRCALAAAQGFEDTCRDAADEWRELYPRDEHTKRGLHDE